VPFGVNPAVAAAGAVVCRERDTIHAIVPEPVGIHAAGKETRRETHEKIRVAQQESDERLRSARSWSEE
jgi:hypothetical protein